MKRIEKAYLHRQAKVVDSATIVIAADNAAIKNYLLPRTRAELVDMAVNRAFAVMGADAIEVNFDGLGNDTDEIQAWCLGFAHVEPANADLADGKLLWHLTMNLGAYTHATRHPLIGGTQDTGTLRAVDTIVETVPAVASTIQDNGTDRISRYLYDPLDTDWNLVLFKSWAATVTLAECAARRIFNQ